MNPRNFFAELKRRNVYKVAIAYAVVGWLLIQAASIILPTFEAPAWMMKVLIAALAIGFPLAVVLAWAFEITPEGIKRADEVPRNESITARTGRKLVAIIVALAVIAAGLLLFQLLRSKSASLGGTVGAPAAAEKSIAVLPFENLSEERANAYFATGIRDEILTRLAKIGVLKLISRTSTARYASAPNDLREIARQLNVANILEGSVQKAGDRVRINVQLIQTASDNHLWAETYDRQLADIFGVEGEVAEKVAETLKLKLAPSETRELSAAATTNTRAHDFYLRGHALLAHSDEHSLDEAIALFRQAVAEDPHYSVAWAELVSAYVGVADVYRAPADILVPARHAALMAVESDDNASVGHVWLGVIALLYDWNFPLARQELQRAITLDQNAAEAHRWYGWYLARVERNFVAARAEIERARALDPLFPWPVWMESLVAIAQGDYDSALRLAEQILAIDPKFLYDGDPIAHVYVAMGRWTDALQRYETLPKSMLSGANFELAVCYAHTGDAARATRILHELEALAPHRYVDQTRIAAIYAALGDKDKAFAALERAAEDRSARVNPPRFFRLLAPLFDDSRFAAFEYKIAHSAILLPEQNIP